MIAVIIVLVVLLAVSLPLTWKLAIAKKNKEDEELLNSKKNQAQHYIDNAIAEGNRQKQEKIAEGQRKADDIVLKAREKALAARNSVEDEVKERRAEISKQERRVQSKEDTLDRKTEAMERREADYTAKEAELKKKQKKIDLLHDQQVEELERISGMTSEEAKQTLLKSVQDDVKIDVAKMYRELVEQAKNDADKKAREIVVN